MSAPSPKKRTFQAPTGTRDFYPREMLVRRYITDAWRRVSLRHGFDEIDGPTFESAELYKVKSGEGILNEMFGVFSGKAESARNEPDAQASGSFDPRNPPFALRPEFTPTLARMYAARAKQLPQPTKWFTVNNFFRAERPQRGRLREFWQWNCDVIGGETDESDEETLGVAVVLFEDLGFHPEDIHARVGNRRVIENLLAQFGMEPHRLNDVLSILDKRLDPSCPLESMARQVGIEAEQWNRIWWAVKDPFSIVADTNGFVNSFANRIQVNNDEARSILLPLLGLCPHLINANLKNWSQFDLALARGLAYYTGMVFEVIAEGHRAVAGGGRYDNLIELFGGPPTPACGFGMGDAVLGNLLEDRKLIPEGREMLEALSRPMPMRPDVFVIPSPKEGCEELVVPTVARLRRGEESEKYRQGECRPWSAERYSVPPLHARRSYKATKNVGKLLAEASACHARFAAIVESAETCTLKNLDTGEQEQDVPIAELGKRVAATGP